MNSPVGLGRALWMFALGVMFYLYEFLLRVAPNPLFADLMRDFDIQAADLGILFSSYLLPYALMQLPVGALMDRLGPRRLLTAAIVLCAGSTLYFAQTHLFSMVCFSRVFIGIGSAFAFISCMKIIRLWFPVRLFPILTGLILTVGNIGAVLGVASLSTALEWWPWRTLFIYLGLFGLVLAVLSWCLVRDGVSEPQQGVWADFWTNVKAVMSRPLNWLVALLALLCTAPTDAFGGLWGTPFLVQVHDIDRNAASIAVSMTFVGVALGSPLMGWLSTLRRSRRWPVLLGAVLSTLSLLLLIYAPVLTAWTAGLLFLSFGTFGTYVMSFVILGDVNPEHLLGTAIGFVNGMSMLGGTVLTAGIGLFLEHSGVERIEDGVSIYSAMDYRIIFGLFPLFYLLTVLLILFCMKESYPEKG